LFKSKEPEGRKRLLAAFERFALDHRLPTSARQAADLAMEEHLTNILRYGFADAAAEHLVSFKFSSERGEFVIEISDDGKAFDPTKFPEPDFSVPIEKRKIGGLGIHMMRKSMDALEYERANGRNVLRMRKRF
jgi:anti-sigma regulatory factor (Ser/Thr protein kinase)